MLKRPGSLCIVDLVCEEPLKGWRTTFLWSLIYCYQNEADSEHRDQPTPQAGADFFMLSSCKTIYMSEVSIVELLSDTEQLRLRMDTPDGGQRVSARVKGTQNRIRLLFNKQPEEQKNTSFVKVSYCRRYMRTDSVTF